MKQRDKKGKFIKGIRYSRNTEFKKGEHWREKKPFWDKDWCLKEYIENKRSAVDIANQFTVTENAILFWLKKHNIKTRKMADIRKSKYWGLKGKSNGMFGKTGRLNPNWTGGHTPERQSAYCRFYWKELAKTILQRDRYKCQECDTGRTSLNKLTIHHIKEWGKYPELRFETKNLITLCQICHKKKHSRRK